MLNVFPAAVISSFRELRRVSALAMMAGIVLLAFTVLSRAQTASAKAQSAASARNAPKKPLLVPRSEYVGDEACARCHEDKAESYDKTAHHLTSQLANKNTILGTFGSGENIMRTSNANLHFRMEAKDDKFFETAVWGTPPNEKTRTHSLDLVMTARPVVPVLGLRPALRIAGGVFDDHAPVD
jgi:hypothetical protein